LARDYLSASPSSAYIVHIISLEIDLELGSSYSIIKQPLSSGVGNPSRNLETASARSN
jgi:hypothetical protein